MQIEYKILSHAKKFYQHRSGFEGHYERLPSYATSGSAGMDLCIIEDVTLYPGECKLVGTGIAIHIGSYLNENNWSMQSNLRYAGLILPRSGLGNKGLVLGNGTGVIDEDYQGEIKISLWNRSNEECYYDGDEIYQNNPLVELKAGDRVAQLMFIPIVKPSFTIVEEFSNNTQRGAGGFGHTGE